MSDCVFRGHIWVEACGKESTNLQGCLRNIACPAPISSSVFYWNIFQTAFFDDYLRYPPNRAIARSIHFQISPTLSSSGSLRSRISRRLAWRSSKDTGQFKGILKAVIHDVDELVYDEDAGGDVPLQFTIRRDFSKNEWSFAFSWANYSKAKTRSYRDCHAGIWGDVYEI